MNMIVPIKLQVPDRNVTLQKDVSQYTEVEKMIHCLPYVASTSELINARAYARNLLKKFNQSDPIDSRSRLEMLKQLFGTCSNNLHIESPFYCDYGSNICLGENVYMNYNCILLDAAQIIVGDRTMFGPNVQLYTTTRSTDIIERRYTEYAESIRIGKDCWIGGSAIILPGIIIGDGSTVGAGSVVTKNVEPYCVVAGNPAKIIKRLEMPVEQLTT